MIFIIITNLDKSVQLLLLQIVSSVSANWSRIITIVTVTISNRNYTPFPLLQNLRIHMV